MRAGRPRRSGARPSARGRRAAGRRRTTSGGPRARRSSRSARRDVAGEEAGVRDLVAAGVVDRVGDGRLDDLDARHLARRGASERPIVPMPQ
jgi:hypothetical protein